MGNLLTEEEKRDLKNYHRVINNPKQRDQIKAILLLDAEWSYKKIAEIVQLVV